MSPQPVLRLRRVYLCLKHHCQVGCHQLWLHQPQGHCQKWPRRKQGHCQKCPPPKQGQCQLWRLHWESLKLHFGIPGTSLGSLGLWLGWLGLWRLQWMPLLLRETCLGCLNLIQTHTWQLLQKLLQQLHQQTLQATALGC